MKNAGEALSHAHQRASIQTYIGIIQSLDWPTFTCMVEFKDSPGLTSRGRIATVSGSGGTLYPPLKNGDLVEVRVAGHDLDHLLRDRVAGKVTNPYFYDKTDVLVGLSPFAKVGEVADRKASSPPNPGEWLLVHESGVEIRIEEHGRVVIKAAEGGRIYLGGTANAKKALVDGDSNVAGGVSATQDVVWIGEPS